MRLAIDPGISTGWATFDDSGRLTACGRGDPRKVTIPGLATGGQATIERPQVYRPRHSKGDPNDLITLAIRVGEYKEFLQRNGFSVSLVWPHDWKGSVDKIVMCNRVLMKLPALEQGIYAAATADLDPESKIRLDVLDAIGLGKWTWGP